MSLQTEVIERLEELGAREDRLWLVEASSIDHARQFYSDRLVDDLTQFTPDENNYIVYYHESGTIESLASFNIDDEKSKDEAIKYIAEYLGAEV